MSASWFVGLFFLGNLVVVGLWDMYAHASGQETVSAVISDWSKSFPELPFIAGLLGGHLFL